MEHRFLPLSSPLPPSLFGGVVGERGGVGAENVPGSLEWRKKTGTDSNEMSNKHLWTQILKRGEEIYRQASDAQRRDFSLEEIKHVEFLASSILTEVRIMIAADPTSATSNSTPSTPSTPAAEASGAPENTDEGPLKSKQKRRGRPPIKKPLCCQECGTTETPEWRRGESGPNTLCNGCGLRYAKRVKTQQEEARKAEQTPPKATKPHKMPKTSADGSVKRSHSLKYRDTETSGKIERSKSESYVDDLHKSAKPPEPSKRDGELQLPKQESPQTEQQSRPQSSGRYDNAQTIYMPKIVPTSGSNDEDNTTADNTTNTTHNSNSNTNNSPPNTNNSPANTNSPPPNQLNKDSDTHDAGKNPGDPSDVLPPHWPHRPSAFHHPSLSGSSPLKVQHPDSYGMPSPMNTVMMSPDFNAMSLQSPTNKMMNAQISHLSSLGIHPGFYTSSLQVPHLHSPELGYSVQPNNKPHNYPTSINSSLQAASPSLQHSSLQQSNLQTANLQHTAQPGVPHPDFVNQLHIYAQQLQHLQQLQALQHQWHQHHQQQQFQQQQHHLSQERGSSVGEGAPILPSYLHQHGIALQHDMQQYLNQLHRNQQLNTISSPPPQIPATSPQPTPSPDPQPQPPKQTSKKQPKNRKYPT